MALLNQKERILDVALTDKGRELLSKNQLRFIYYAFSDEGIDYGATTLTGSDYDEFIHRGMSFEAKQRRSETDLSTFLYSANPSTEVLPIFQTSLDEGYEDLVDVDRYFHMGTIEEIINSTTTPIGATMKATVPPQITERVDQYATEQQIQSAITSQLAGETIVGQKVAPNHTAISENVALNTVNGTVSSILQAQAAFSPQYSEEQAKKLQQVAELQEFVEDVVELFEENKGEQEQSSPPLSKTMKEVQILIGKRNVAAAQEKQASQGQSGQSQASSNAALFGATTVAQAQATTLTSLSSVATTAAVQAQAPPNGSAQLNSAQIGGVLQQAQTPQAIPSVVEAISIEENIEIIDGLEELRIDLDLKAPEGRTQPSAGFLVEVFLSGSGQDNEKLTKLNRNNTANTLSDQPVKTGFKKFIQLEIDK